MTTRTRRLWLVSASSLPYPSCQVPLWSRSRRHRLDPMAPSHWTGTWTGTSNEGMKETEGPGYTDVLVTTNGIVEASDPRINGQWIQNHHISTYHGPEGDVSVASATARIDNEGGSWAGTFTGYYTDSAVRNGTSSWAMARTRA